VKDAEMSKVTRMSGNEEKQVEQLSILADAFISMLVMGSTAYVGFILISSELLPLAKLVLIASIAFAVSLAIVAGLYFGVLRTRTVIGTNIKVILSALVVIGAGVHEVNTLYRAIAEKKAVDEQAEVSVCQQKILTDFPDHKQSIAWCKIVSNRAQLR